MSSTDLLRALRKIEEIRLAKSESSIDRNKTHNSVATRWPRLILTHLRLVQLIT